MINKFLKILCICLTLFAGTTFAAVSVDTITRDLQRHTEDVEVAIDRYSLAMGGMRSIGMAAHLLQAGSVAQIAAVAHDVVNTQSNNKYSEIAGSWLTKLDGITSFSFVQDVLDKVFVGIALSPDVKQTQNLSEVIAYVVEYYDSLEQWLRTGPNGWRLYNFKKNRFKQIFSSFANKIELLNRDVSTYRLRIRSCSDVIRYYMCGAR